MEFSQINKKEKQKSHSHIIFEKKTPVNQVIKFAWPNSV